MTFTQEEEEILRLMIDELTTRKKLDIANQLVHTEVKTAWTPIKDEIDDIYNSTLLTLKSDAVNAEKAIVERFK